ncbi:Hsp70 family protein [Gordonia sp. NPDC003504]
MSIVLGLHLQTDRVLAVVSDDPSPGGSAFHESHQIFPVAVRWPAESSPTLPGRGRQDGIYRHFLDHLGDPRPLSTSSGGPARLADDLAGALIAQIVAAVEDSVHSHASRVLIAHPAYWTVAQVSSFHRALVDAGLHGQRALLAPDFDAALGWIDHTTGLEESHGVGVCDLRGSSAVVGYARRPHSGHLSTVTAHSFPGIGVADLDDRLEYRVLAKASRSGYPVPAHPALRAQVRARCAEVRTSLRSMATHLDIETPGRRGLEHHDVVITLDDLYGLARPQVVEVVDALQRCAPAGRTPDHVVLIGGAPDFPLLAAVVSERFDCAVVTPKEPELVCARGAALLAAAVPTSTPLSSA